MHTKNLDTVFTLVKGFAAALGRPVSFSGRFLSPAEVRQRRAEKARRSLRTKYGISAKHSALSANGASTISVAQLEPFTLQGKLEPGEDSAFSINGQDFVLDDSTWMIGELVFGARATIKGVISERGERLAKSIVVS